MGKTPQFDFNALTRDQFGRRTNPLDPDQSLLLLKPTSQLAHEGGKRFVKGSPEYELLRRWIAEGTTNDLATAPAIEKIEVSPREQIVAEPAETVRLQVRATFTDGDSRDVTLDAVYESANSLVKISPEGLVQRAAFGETTVLVRYLEKQVPVRLAFIQARPGFKWREIPVRNYVDEHVFSKLRTLRMNPSALCTDEVFLRRAYLDLLGILPTADEARGFIADRRRDKRARLIDELLERPEFADFWALKWADLLRIEERTLDRKGMENFHHWIRQSIAEKKPMDQFVQELISARGSTYLNPPANYYRANRTPVTRAEATAQVFLGTRLQCAQCHNHPFDRWTQADYYDWAAVFSRVRYKVLENRRRDSNDSHEFKGEQIVYLAHRGEVKNPRSGKPAEPRFLGTKSPPGFQDANSDELSALAAWITSPENPLFARSQANRIWYHLMGRGIVDPIDDFRATNPASHPELLDALAKDFVRSQFDLRHLIRLIMNSRTYQLSSEPDETNREDETNYSHALVRRLSAEQLLDCQSEVVGVPPAFNGYPVGLRAAQLPGALTARKGSQKAGGTDQFLELFGKPPRLLTCECERSTDTTMGQAFQMISGPSVNDLLTQPDNRISKLLDSGKPNSDIVKELYWVALTRAPTAVESLRAENHLENCKDRRLALEDLTWSLLNAKEFVLRR